MTTDPDRPCPHLQFTASVAVNRIGEAETVDGLPRAYMADITVACADCGEPFRWVGVKAGLSFGRPMVSVDEKELHAPTAARVVRPGLRHGHPRVRDRLPGRAAAD
jgi:hypothetical protein